RMHTSLERLKQEFAVLLEEEKLSIFEGEQKHAELIEKVEQEFLASEQNFLRKKLEMDQHRGGTGDTDFKQLIDSGIRAISALYTAMATVVKHRRQVSVDVIAEKMKTVGALQDQMLEKTKALLESK